MTYFDIDSTNKVNKKSNIRQLVDILQIDIAGKNDNNVDQKTRKNYEVFVTGGLGQNAAVTSSLFHTVFDQDHELQTSNEMIDITIGTYVSGTTVTGLSPTTDASGKLVFSNNTLMMREKINIYKQYAQMLLGDSTKSFTAPFDSSFTEKTGNDLNYNERIDDAVFINVKRLFARDGLDKEQLSFKLFEEAKDSSNTNSLYTQSDASAKFKLYSDVNAKSTLRITTEGGTVGNIIGPDSADGNANQVGVVFYDKGIIVLDAKKVFKHDQVLTGNISSTSNTEGITWAANDSKKLIPDLWTSGSIDNILDHICLSRVGRATSTALGFINQTSINSTLYFCRVGPNDANFSSNPTYIDTDGTLRCIQEKGDDPFSYVTTIGLYNDSNELLAIAKTSRPIEKNPEVDLSISVRIDY